MSRPLHHNGLTDQFNRILLIGGVFAYTLAPSLFGQSASTPVLEAVSIKPNKSADAPLDMRLQGDHWGARYTTLQNLIRSAYQLPDSQVVGSPDWSRSEHFDVLLKAREAISPTALQALIRDVLRERFGFAAHVESRSVPVFALVVSRSDGRLGPQLHKRADDCSAQVMNSPSSAQPRSPEPGKPLPCGTTVGRGPGVLEAGGLPMARLAATLSPLVGRTVVDSTNLMGSYDWSLQWTPDTASAPIDDRPSMFTALQEQLGLKLEATTNQVDVLVIDHVEHPTPD